ncbi:hypothetical protein BX666DRAFT_1864522 [Dichotomocladium elegans]|nr:hypothetical protein BX666DRAFT_1864522 [Dichotomocladium elegans]
MSFPIVPGKLPKPQVLPSVFYPVRGFLHLVHHPLSFGLPILSSAIKASVVSLLAIAPLVKYGFGPQSRLIARVFQGLFHPQMQQPQRGGWLVGSGATLATLVIMLSESFMISNQLGDYFIGSVRDRFFDACLDERGGLPKKKADHKTAATASIPSAEQAKVEAHRYLSPLNIMILHAQKDETWALFFLRPILFLGTLPLNLVPVVGPAAFVAIQAFARGGSTHKRYFDLYNWSDAKRQRRIEKAFGEYHRFGMVATLLEMIPFLGFVFSYTNHIGAAMWIMDLKESDHLEGRRFFDISSW